MTPGDHVTITAEHRAFADMVGRLVQVERKPTTADALFLDGTGPIRVITSNGESFTECPVWIIWDTSGYPYPITVEEFERIYTRKEGS